MSKIWKYVVAVALLFVGLAAFAQDKTQAYYSTHESEILPDAQAAFREGYYDRAVELCKWHYIFVGDNRADELRDKAEQCAKLTSEMNALASTGQNDLAREKAQAVLVLNPDDKKAQELSKYDPGSGVIDGHEYVDLGLSVKWATCNVGASYPSDYGSYFAWGETTPKSDYSWKTLKYCESSAGNDFSKYISKSLYRAKDNKTRLDLSDDAARANWGGSWRMPTKAEQDELRIKCTWTWTTRDGKNGYKVTSKLTGNSIFLPAADLLSGASLSHASSYGYYWSSSLYSDDYGSAYNLSIHSGAVDCDQNYRYYGFSVRPVSE